MAANAQPVAVAKESLFELPLRTVSRNVVCVFVSGIHYWHLFSLDAPTVAMLWTWFVARTNHILLPPTAIVAMGLAVWTLYAFDRLLDSRGVPSSALIGGGHQRFKPRELEPRHFFHRRHQRGFRLGILAASVALALLLPQFAPQSLHLYLVLGTLLFSYFVLIHANSGPVAKAKAHRLPKELAVGAFFSAAVFIPTVSRAPELRLTLFPGALLFAVLCSLNCLFIYAWEHPLSSPEIYVQTHAATRIALRLLPHLTILSILIALMLTLTDELLSWLIPAACVLATSFLLLLHHNRRRFSPTSLRAAADLCLLTPTLLIPLLRH